MHVRGLHPKFCAIRAFSTSSKCPYRGETIPMHVRGLPPTLHAICAFSKSPQTQTPIEATRVTCTYPGCTKSFNQNGTRKPVERARSFAGLNEKPAPSLTPWARACQQCRRWIFCQTASIPSRASPLPQGIRPSLAVSWQTRRPAQ